MRMKKMVVWSGALCLMLTVFAGSVHAAQVVKLAVTFDQATPMVQAARKFAELWESKSNGAYKVNIYPGGEIGRAHV